MIHHSAQSDGMQGVHLKAILPSAHDVTSNSTSDKFNAAQTIPIAPLQCDGNVAKPRAILTSQQAIAIFRLKLASDGTRPSASTVSRVYGVSEKTIRDIWNGRTWFEDTARFEPTRPMRNARPLGRPKGRKDRVPRRSRQSKSSRRPTEDADDSSDPATSMTVLQTKSPHEISGCAFDGGGEGDEEGRGAKPAGLCDSTATGGNRFSKFIRSARGSTNCQKSKCPLPLLKRPSQQNVKPL